MAVRHRADRNDGGAVPLDDIIADLFGDMSYFVDVNAFWTLQNACVASLRDELAAKGWKATLLEKGTRFPA
jgi:ParB family transcriptional regulator, chromosome partitioning protein